MKDLILRHVTLPSHVGRGFEDRSSHSEHARDRPISDVEHIVRYFLKRNQIAFLCDGTVSVAGALQKAETPAQISEYLETEALSYAKVLNRLMLEQKALRRKISKGDVDRALQFVRDERVTLRKKRIIEDTTRALDPNDQAAVAEHWRRLASTAFEAEPELVVACLQHFIWQVKRKCLGLDVDYHLMPVVVSPHQGSGKMTFVRKLLSPWHELQQMVSLSQIADRRNRDMYQFPVLMIDDVEKVDRRQVALIKSFMTSTSLLIRTLGTSNAENFQQKSTLIGTANSSIEHLIDDDTGHRRFVSLLFRNGNTAVGGDARVWQVVNDMEPLLMWRAVDGYGPAPRAPHLKDLASYQFHFRKRDVLLTWLHELDVESEAVVSIRQRYGVPAHKLYLLFGEQTGDVMSETAFGNQMNVYVEDPAVPFGQKVKKTDCWVYPLKQRMGPA